MNARVNGSPSSASTVPGALFRDAMSHIAASVHVVTTAGPHGKCGFTATSVCSVTDDPPTVLVCLNQASGMHAAFEGNGVFCINTLGADQQELSELFGGGRGGDENPDRFTDPGWAEGVLGAPVHEGALVRVECEVGRVDVMGTHYVIFGRVVRVGMADSEPALVYFERSYHSLAGGKTRG